MTNGLTTIHELSIRVEWIEHWPKESTDGGEETFDLVVLSGYEIKERAPYLGEAGAWVGGATWNPLDRTVEALVRNRV